MQGNYISISAQPIDSIAIVVVNGPKCEEIRNSVIYPAKDTSSTVVPMVCLERVTTSDWNRPVCSERQFGLQSESNSLIYFYILNLDD
jgi:hypothetical protein